MPARRVALEAFGEPSGGLVGGSSSEPGAPGGKPSLWRRPGFWVGVGVAAVAGSVAIYVATRDDGGCSSGCIDLR